MPGSLFTKSIPLEVDGLLKVRTVNVHTKFSRLVLTERSKSENVA